jgi:carbohydrate-selective porin OprB
MKTSLRGNFSNKDAGLPKFVARTNPGCEILLEATYQIELTTWLSVQPDVQYVIHPSGTDIANALVLGARTTMFF